MDRLRDGALFRVQDGIRQNTVRAMDEEEDTLSSVADFDNITPTKKQQQQSGRFETVTAREKIRAKSLLKRMRAHISGWVLKITAYLLFKLLRLILRTVQISPTQVEMVKKAAKVRSLAFS